MNYCRHSVRFLAISGLISLVFGASSRPAMAALTAEINPFTGSVVIRSAGTTDFELYQLTELLAGDNWNTGNSRWNSVTDQGLTSSWGELAGGSLLAEASLTSEAIMLLDGGFIDLGTPYDGPSSALNTDFAFTYLLAGESVTTAGSVAIVSVPEPSSGTLAAILLLVSVLCWLTKRRRGRKTAPVHARA